MSGITPQQRSRDNLTARGYLVGSVERRKRFPDRKKSPCSICKNQPMIEISVDLWNIFDLVAVLPGGDARNHLPCTVFVQTTSRTNHATRRNKVLASMEAKLVLLSGARILIQSWKQPDGEWGRWMCFDEWLTLADYAQAPHYPNSVAELVEIKRKAKFPDFPPGVTLPLSGDLKDEEMPF
jgi:hypothetical protein